MANPAPVQVPDFAAMDSAIEPCAENQRAAAQFKLIRNIPPLADGGVILAAIAELRRDIREQSAVARQQSAVARARDHNTYARMLNSHITKDDQPFQSLHSVNDAQPNTLDQPIVDIPLNGNEMRNIQAARCRRILTALKLELPGEPTVRELRVQVRQALGLISTF